MSQFNEKDEKPIEIDEPRRAFLRKSVLIGASASALAGAAVGVQSLPASAAPVARQLAGKAASTKQTVGNPVWLAVGGDIRWGYGNGTNNLGPQYAEANPMTPDADMETTSQGLALQDNGSMLYGITIHNFGPQPCFHNIWVGGF